jgi:hemerythrin
MQAPFITWTEKMSVGVEVLDADHKRLIDLLNDLHDGIAAGHGTERLERVLDGLVDYVATHFAREEELFAKTVYPGAAEHIQEHRALTKLVKDVQARYNQGKFEALSLNIMNFLKDWLIEHIQGSDRNYKAHLNAMGIH